MRRLRWLSSASMAAGIALMLIPTHRALAQLPDVSIEVLDATTRAEAGDNVTYTVRVTNNGPGTAGFAHLLVSVSSQLTLTRASCNPAGDPYYCPLFTMQPGQSKTVTFEGSVCCFERGSSRRATFEAKVVQSGDPNLDNNIATVSTQIMGPFQD